MIIGLLGFIGSGKGTVANILQQEYNFKPDSFASSLKDACAAIFDWPRDLLEGDTVESRAWREVTDDWWAQKLGIPDFTPRLALQLIGTDSLRNYFHQDIWFLTLQNRLRKNPDANVVISDVRFPNEVKMVKEINLALKIDIEYFRLMSTRVQTLNSNADFFINYIAGGNSYNDSLYNKIFGLNSGISIQYNRGPYDALKASGIDKISSDSVRNELIYFYDFSYPKFISSLEHYNRNHTKDIETIVANLHW